MVILVSICCQAYNHKDYIVKALDGFLMQKTNFEFEILLRDDASTDGTSEICKKYANKYSDKIKLLAYTENQYQKGVSPFIDNVKRAKGKYIAMCEGDDFWTDPLKLQKQVDGLEKHKELNICSHKSIKYDEERKAKIGVIGDNGDSAKVIPLKEVILKFGYTSPMQTILFRNINIENFIRLKSDAIGSHGIMQVFYASPNGILYLPEVMSVYRSNSAGSLTKTVLVNETHYANVLRNRIKTFKRLDQYFNLDYSTEFNKKIKETQNIFIGSRLISYKNKKKFITENDLKMISYNSGLRLIRSYLSHAKHILGGYFYER